MNRNFGTVALCELKFCGMLISGTYIRPQYHTTCGSGDLILGGISQEILEICSKTSLLSTPPIYIIFTSYISCKDYMNSESIKSLAYSAI